MKQNTMGEPTAQPISPKLLIMVVAILMGCSFQADDYEITGVKSQLEIALPLAFGEITINDILERQFNTPGIVVNSTLQIATGIDANIILDDTVELDLGDIENSEVLSASLKINTENEMPIEGVVQLILVDNNYVVIESLVSADQSNWIKSSTVDGTGNVITKGVFNQTIELDKAKVDKLLDAKRMIIKARLSTRRENGVAQVVSFQSALKLFNHYGLKIKLKTQVDL